MQQRNRRPTNRLRARRSNFASWVWPTGVIAARLGVTDKTISKAVAWLTRHHRDCGRRGIRGASKPRAREDVERDLREGFITEEDAREVLGLEREALI